MRAWAFAVLLLTATLAGCLGSEDPEQATEGDQALSTTQTDASGSAKVLTRPNWTVGQYWTWDSNLGTYSYVVTADAGSDWIVDTDSEQVAFFDARTDVSFLGPVRKSDLAGSQGDTRVAYFQWPLVENATWSTQWDGVERTIEVVSIEDGVAELEARQDGRLAVAYEYDKEVGWFGDVTFYGPNGTERVDADLTDAGTGFSGEPVRWNLETIFDVEDSFGPVPHSWGGEFTVAENATDVWLSFNVSCPAQSVVSFGVNKADASQDGWGTLGPCQGETSFEGPIDADDHEGRWSHGMAATAPTEDASYTALLYVRTLETVEISG